MADQIRYRKTLEQSIPVTKMLDNRKIHALAPVVKPREHLKEIKRDRSNSQPVEVERIPELTEPRLVAEMRKITIRRNPAEANTLLILEPVLRDFVQKFTVEQKQELMRLLHARVCLVVTALRHKYRRMKQDMQKKGVFHPAANGARCESMLQVELRRVRLEVLEVDVIEEMAYEAAAKRWKEEHPDGDEPPLDPDAVIPRAPMHRRQRKNDSKAPVRKRRENHHRWKQQCTVAPAIRIRAMGGAAKAKFVQHREVRQLNEVSRPRRPADVRPWRKTKANADGTTDDKAANTTANKLPKSPITTKGRDGDNKDAASSADAPTNLNMTSTAKSRPKGGLKNHSDAILRIWKLLEVPVGHQLDFLCKFSEPLHAAIMEATVNKLDEVCTMIVTREFMLDLMRRLQKGERIKPTEALKDEHEDCLKAHGCFVSVVDDFGNTLFNRLGNMVRQLSEALRAEIEFIEREYDEKVT